MKKLNKNILFGLGAISAVVAPVATLVACGNSKTEDGNSKTEDKIAARTLVEIKAVAVQADAIDLTKLNNTYELALLLSDMSGVNQIKGIANHLQHLDASNPETYKTALKEVNDIFTKATSINHTITIKNGSNSVPLKLDLTNEITTIVAGLQKAFINGQPDGVAAMSWSQGQVPQLLTKFTEANKLMVANGVPTLSVDDFVNGMVSKMNQNAQDAGKTTNFDNIKPVYSDILNNGQTLFDKVQQSMSNITSLPIVRDLGNVFGLNSLQPVLKLTELPIGAVGGFFDVITNLSTSLEDFENSNTFMTWTNKDAKNPDKDQVTNNVVSSYNDDSLDSSAVLNAVFGYVSIV